MNSKKIGFIQRVKIAICNMERYQEFALEKSKESLKYFAKLVLIFVIIVLAAFSIKIITTINLLIDVYKTDFPEFSFNNNQLISEEVVSKEIKKDNNEIYLIVDTNIDYEDEKVKDYMTEITKHKNGIIFLKDRFIFGMENLEGQSTFMYEKLGIEVTKEVNKQSLEETLNNGNYGPLYFALSITIGFYLYISYFISIAMEVIMLAVLGYLVSKIVRVNIKFLQIVNMSVYSITLAVLLTAIYNAFNIITGFNISYFSVIYITVPYIYLITAILMIRSDLINRQVEVTRITKVQEEVREELEKENPDNKEKKKDKKEEEKEQDKNENGEPEGSKA